MDPAYLVTLYVVFVYSTTCHEAAHAWVAMKLGDRTAYHGGQVSLDPIPHMMREPVGMLVVPVLSLLLNGRLFGWASAPLGAEWVRENPRGSALVSIAGPISNFLLSLIALALMDIGVRGGVFVDPSDADWPTQVVSGHGGPFWQICAMVVSAIFTLNLLLGCFNLLPLPPLDGSNLPMLFLRGRPADQYLDFIGNPAVRMVTFVVAFSGFAKIYSPIYRAVREWASHLLFAGQG